MSDTTAEQEDAPASVGAMLTRAREACELSAGDVAHALRLGLRQVEALEADDYAALPERPFVRGFIRNYARLVHLDPEQAVAAYLAVQPEAAALHIQAPSQHIRISEHHGLPWLKWLATAFAVVALASWGILQWMGPEQPRAQQTDARQTPEPSAPAPAAPGTTETEARVSPEAPAPATGHTLVLSFSGPAWVEVRDRNGNKIHSQNNPAGTEQSLEGEAPLSLVIGSAPNVKLSWRGRPVDLAAHAKGDVARLTLE